MKAISYYFVSLIIFTGFILVGCADQYGAYKQTTKNDMLVSNEVQRNLDIYRNGMTPQSNVNVSKTKQENKSVPQTKQEKKSITPMVEIKSGWMEDFLQTLLDRNEIQIETINDLDIPIESRFEIKGHYGCLVAFPYNIIIHQKGEDVIVTNITKQGKKEYRQDFNKFLIFWLICSPIDINSLKISYEGGNIVAISTADFRGKLSISVTTRQGELSKDLRIRAGANTFEGEDITKLIKAMTWLVHGDNLVFSHFKELWE